MCHLKMEKTSSWLKFIKRSVGKTAFLFFVAVFMTASFAFAQTKVKDVRGNSIFDPSYGQPKAKGTFPHNTISVGKDLYVFPMRRWGFREIDDNVLRGSYKLQFSKRWSFTLSGTVFLHWSDAIFYDENDTSSYYSVNNHELDLHVGYKVWEKKENSLHALLGPVARDAAFTKSLSPPIHQSVGNGTVWKETFPGGFYRQEFGIGGGLLYEWRPLRNLVLQSTLMYAVYNSPAPHVFHGGVAIGYSFL